MTKAVSRPPAEKVSKLPELPARLSPLHLPARLSPTLPAKILASLEARHHHRSTSSGSTMSDKPLKSTTQRPDSKHDSVLSDADRQKPAQKISQLAQPLGSHQEASTSKPALSTKEDNVKRETPPNTEDLQNDSQPRPLPALLVKLKIPRHHRGNVRRLLAMPPARKNNDRRDAETKEDAAKGVARKASKASGKAHVPGEGLASKRPRLDIGDASPPAAKRNAPEDAKLEKAPRTPVQPSFESPTLPSSVQKLQLTPAGHRDLRTSVAMKRVESSDGPSSTPPINDHTPSSKPGVNAAQQNSSMTRPSPSASSASTKTPESQAWADEHMRLGAVGRDLKHSLQVYRKRNDGSAALASLESFLAFILAFYCQEQSMATRDPPLTLDPTNSWLTLHGFWNAVCQQCRPYPRLYGLASHLGVFYNGVIFARLGSGSKSRDVEKDLRNLQDAALALTKAGRSAEENLPLTAVISDFPQTWKRYSAQGISVTAEDHTRPGQYEGRLILPFGTHTTPLHAVRAGHAMLSEWVAKADLGYKMKLSLRR